MANAVIHFFDSFAKKKEETMKSKEKPLKMLLIAMFLFLVGGFSTCFSQLKSYNMNDIERLNQEQRRITVVFLHTDWCQYCKAMQRTTFRNKTVEALLNENFYFVSFDAESKDEVQFAGKILKYRPRGRGAGEHQLVDLLLGDEERVYPQMVFINSKNEEVYRLNGFVRAKELEKTLRILVQTGNE